jgi:transposase
VDVSGSPFLPASSGKTSGRLRLNGGGNRQANAAPYRIVIVRWHEVTKIYVPRRTAEGMSKKDIIRCLKRYVPRDVHRTCPSRTPRRQCS